MDPQRARRILIVAWIVVALVPVAILGGWFGGKYVGRWLGLSLLVAGALAELASPMMLVVTGYRLRHQQATPSSLTLGRVAIGLYVVMIVVLGWGIVSIVRAAQDGSMAGLGLAVGGAFLVLLSLLPWLASVVTGGVFTVRILRTLMAVAWLLTLSSSTLACEGGRPMSDDPVIDPAAPEPSAPATPEPAARADEREHMVRMQLLGRDIDDPRVLAAMRQVPRHEFVPDAWSDQAYDDGPLPIGHGVTISQPYIVALMTQLAEVQPGDRVLDVGTGSGYQAAVLVAMGAEVFGIEIIEPLATAAAERLTQLGYPATIRHGDGYRGWPEHAPFDAIILAAAPSEIPRPLTEQLAVGGHLVLPVGDRYQQDLVVVTRTPTGLRERRITGVAFVPMTGEGGATG